MAARCIPRSRGATFLVIALIAGVLVPGCLFDVARRTQIHVAPPSAMAGLGSGVASIIPTGHGHPLVLFLFATWCKYSAYEARYVVPRLAAYVARHGGHVVGIDETNLLGVGQAGPLGQPVAGDSRPLHPRGHLDTAAAAVAVAAYRRLSGLSIPLVADPDLTLKQRLGLYFDGAYPTFVFVTATGRVVMRAEGAQPFAALASTFDDAATLR